MDQKQPSGGGGLVKAILFPAYTDSGVNDTFKSDTNESSPTANEDDSSREQNDEEYNTARNKQHQNVTTTTGNTRPPLQLEVPLTPTNSNSPRNNDHEMSDNKSNKEDEDDVKTEVMQNLTPRASEASFAPSPHNTPKSFTSQHVDNDSNHANSSPTKQAPQFPSLSHMAPLLSPRLHLPTNKGSGSGSNYSERMASPLRRAKCWSVDTTGIAAYKNVSPPLSPMSFDYHQHQHQHQQQGNSANNGSGNHYHNHPQHHRAGKNTPPQYPRRMTVSPREVPPPQAFLRESKSWDVSAARAAAHYSPRQFSLSNNSGGSSKNYPSSAGSLTPRKSSHTFHSNIRNDKHSNNNRSPTCGNASGKVDRNTSWRRYVVNNGQYNNGGRPNGTVDLSDSPDVSKGKQNVELMSPQVRFGDFCIVVYLVCCQSVNPMDDYILIYSWSDIFMFILSLVQK